MLNVYGIKNCNTVKKALDWLNENQIAYTFHDYKKEPAQDSKLMEWQKLTSWENLVNKKGTTWKKLSAEQQAAVVDEKSAREVLLSNNSMIKRPVIELENDIILGFDEETYKQKLSNL
ncbi:MULTISPECIES: Spx/MgsR family RNA polymerase-binding regulatory protein [Sphingobacterium]|uniref:Spx/MgsR family RNA polymerase-binding regulatory protein n=1 Tax=Sphingobacterium litopenaei TaxID=2763500 RepID=A0ABR7YDG5_9SPHI|nr:MULTISPECIES: Spx/MgsR family RNA polymerase-binding regulatory protein [Sphingobacterium]MBD1429321.1 Spx/MgsR family RNA polymerase-binding regulatory protein [Sphingobacterium litopenaei]NGM71965.1 Spx/MgsR family RNA polymerase-binding regulatory protein [Sphingobacterium sp. SGL-16]